MYIINHVGALSSIDDKIAEICDIIGIYDFLPPTHPKKSTDKLLSLVNQLNDDTHFYMEYPYVDKLYRDSYYNHYGKKHYEYHRDCIRISFFKKAISQEIIKEGKNTEKELQNNFLGYAVVRPLKSKRLGRTFVSPEAFKNNNFISCLVKEKVLINGTYCETQGFPCCPQDDEYTTCAEMSIWSAMEYFGSKYKEYGTILPSQIHAVFRKMSYERTFPSNGYSEYDISYALKKFGFGSKIYDRAEYLIKKKESSSKGASIDDREFRILLNDYVESGIPVIAILSQLNSEDKLINRNEFHSYVIIGHKIIDNVEITYEENSEKLNLVQQNTKINLSDSSMYENREYVVMDDNYPPYRYVTYSNPDASVEKNKIYRIDKFIVPLHRKVHLESIKAREIAKTILEYEKNEYLKYLGINNSDVISRVLLTSTRSFRNYLTRNFQLEIISKKPLNINRGLYASKINNAIKWLLLQQALPKFIWIIEMTNLEFAYRKRCTSFIILDATSVNSSQGAFDESLIAVAYQDKFFIKFDERDFSTSSKIVEIGMNMVDYKTQVSYNQYSNNLKHFSHDKT